MQVLDLRQVWEDMPEKADVSDLISKFGGETALDLLFKLNENTPEWTPPEPEEAVDAKKQFIADRRYQWAKKRVGEENALLERPPFIFIKERRNRETGEMEKLEYVDCPMLAQTVRDEEHFFFVKFPKSDAIMKYWYANGVYSLIPDTQFKAYIKRKIECWNPGLVRMQTVKEVFDNLCADLRFRVESDKDTDELLINFRNGLFDVTTGTVKPHTPDIFTTRQVPCEYPGDPENANRKCPNFWRFMKRFCFGADYDHPDGEARFRLLMEFIAVLLSNINGGKFKKSLWLVGDGDSGKSQLLKLLEYLLGEENCYSCDLAKLESERFAGGGIYGTRFVFAPDLKFIKVPELSFFKMLTGDDRINVEKKGIDGFGYHFSGLCAFAMNRLPRFGGDDGKHVFDRMIIFQCPEGVPKSEQDTGLLKKMESEAPYICAWALQYLPGVIKNGRRFTELADADNARKSYQLQNSSVGRFLCECCVDVSRPRDDVERAQVENWRGLSRKPTIKSIYQAYKDWHKEEETGFPLSYTVWKDKLKEIYGVSEDKELVPSKDRSNRGRIIPFFCLNEEAARRYLID